MKHFSKHGRDFRAMAQGRDVRAAGPGRDSNVSTKGATHKHDSKSALRALNMNLLLTAGGVEKEQLADALEMPIPRIVELIDGLQPVSPEMAQHVESMLELETGWLDKRNNAPESVTPKTISIIKGEAVSYWNNLGTEEHPAEAAVTPAVVKEQKRNSPPTVVLPAKTGRKANQSNVVSLVPRAEAPKPESVVSPAAPAETRTELKTAATSESSSPNQISEITESKEKSMATPETLQANRRKNFENLTASKGAKAKIARLMGCSAGHVTLLINGGRAFLEETARNTESMLGLQKNWLDAPHSAADVPDSALMAIFNERPVAPPTAFPDKPRRGRPTTAARQLREAEAQASGAPAGGAAPAAPAPAPAAAAPAPAPAAGAAPAPAAAPAAAAPAPAASRTFTRDVQPAAAAPASIGSVLSPIVEALIRTISEKATTGQLQDAEAYELLGKLMVR